MARKTDIRLRRSNVANTPPGSADLNLGELAINTMDGALYFKKSDGTIITGHDNTIMHIDSTNDRVGIRTTSPAGPLHVDGHTGSLATILEGNGNGDTVPLHFRVKANNNNVTSHGIFGNAGSTGAGNFIQIGASNTSGISVMSDGNVGIGITAPDTKLHVNGSSIRVGPTSGPFADFKPAQLFATNAYHFASGNNTFFHFSNSSNAAKVSMDMANARVGIGVSSPTSLLDIRSSGNVDIMSKIINTQQTSNGRKTEFLFGKDNGANLSGVLKYVYNTTQASRRIDLVHYQTTNGISILDGGNVGVGTDSPIAKLDVVRGGATGLSSINARTTLLLQNNNSAGTVLSINAPNTGYSGIFLGDPQQEAQGQIKQVHTTNAMEFTSSSGASEMALKAGKLGIGTIDPTETLTVSETSSGNLMQVASFVNPVGTANTGVRLWLSGTNTTTRGTFIDAVAESTANDHSLRFGTSASSASPVEHMRIDANGSVFIASTSDSGSNRHFFQHDGFFRHVRSGQIVGVFDRLSTDGNIVHFRKDGADIGTIGTVSNGKFMMGVGGVSGTNLIFADQFDEIYPSQNGVTTLGDPGSKFKDLYLSGTARSSNIIISDATPTITFTDTDNNYDATIAGLSGSLVLKADAGAEFGTETIQFHTGAAEQMRITSLGTVLVGKQAEGTATDGIELNRQDVIVATRNNDSPLILNRRTSDGDIAVFRKDNTVVGSIGTIFGDLYIGTGDTNIRFTDSNDEITPRGANGAARDNAISLGASSVRFKDLHLSGNAYIGSSAYAQYFGNASDTNTLIQFAGSDDIRFRAGGAELIRIKTTGVGIGTISPAAKLHISGNSDISDEDCMLIIDDVDGSAGSRIPAIMFRSNTGGSVTNQGRIRGTDSQGMVLSASSALSNDLVVQAGMIGVGAPSNNTFDSNITAYHATNAIKSQVKLWTNTADNTGTEGGAIEWVASGDKTAVGAKIAATRVAAGGKMDMRFYTGRNTDSDHEKMRIISAGDVGIGTTSPNSYTNQTALTINGTTHSRVDLEVGGTLKGNIHADSGGINIDAGANKVRFFTGNTEKMRLKSNGFLGIGTQSPLDLLHLKSTSTDARQVIDGHTGFDAELKFAENGSVEYTIGHDAATSKFVIGTVNVDTGKRFTINSSGAITFNEAFTFPTSIGSAGQVLKVPSSGTDLIWGSASGGAGGSSIEDNDGDTKIQVEESADEDVIRFDIAGSQKMSLSSTHLDLTGNLQVSGDLNIAGDINSTSVTNLDVTDKTITMANNAGSSTAADGAGIIIEGPTNNASLLWDHANQYLEFNKEVFSPGYTVGTTATKVGKVYNASGVLNVYAYSTREIAFSNATNGEHVRIDGTGNVGIGTDSPSYQLHVAGGGDLLVEDTGGGSAHIRLMSTASGTTTSHYKFKTNAANTFFIDNDTQSTSALTILANGKLGIGTTTPALKLEVKSGGSDDGIQVINSGSTNILGGLIQTGTGDGALIVRNTSNAQTVLFRGQGNNYITGGSVGIGTTSPSSFVESSRFVVGSGTSGTNEMMFLYSGTNTFGALGFADGTSGTEAYRGIMGYDHNTDTMFFSTAGGGNASRDMIIASNGGVSIGTSTTTGSGGLLVSNDIKTNSRIGVGSGGNLSDAAIYKNSDTNTGIIWPAADTLGFTTGGVERARVDGSNFDIESGGFRVNDSGGNYPFAVNQHGFMTTRSASIAQLNATGDHGNVPLSVLADVASTRTASYVEIGDIGSAGNKFIIKSTGNVGIGTNSPNAFLSVRKDNNNSGNQFVVADTEGTSPGVRTYTHGGDDSGLILNHYYALGGSGNEYMRYADFVANVGNGAGTTMRFITKNAANTFSVGLAQDNNGNIGIGTTTPAAKLEVKASNSGSSDWANKGIMSSVQINAANRTYGGLTMVDHGSGSGHAGLGFRYDGTGYKLELGTASSTGSGISTHLTIDRLGAIVTSGHLTVAGDLISNSNVGIGTTPSSRFHLKSASRGSIALRVTDSNTTNDILRSGSQPDGDGFLQLRTVAGAGNVLFDSSGVSYINGGNFGIGTATPNAQLEINSDGSASGGAEIRLQHANNNSTDVVSTVNFANNAGSVAMIQGGTTGANNTGYISFFTDNAGTSAEGMRLDSSGRLLIGTTSSLHGSADLQIQGASGNYARIMLKDQDGTSQHAFIDESTGNISITSQNGTAHGTISLKQYNGTDTLTRLHINDAGNIGIGVTSIPSWANVMTNGTVAVGGILYIKQDQKIQALTAFPGGAGNLKINPDGGNVGIGMGSSTPKAKLQVEEYGIDTSETSTSATTQVTIHSFPTADFRTARFTIQITNSTDSTYHSTEIIAVHNGTTANITEFGEVHTGSSVEATFDADVSSNNFRLRATPATTDNMEFKVVCHSLTV